MDVPQLFKASYFIFFILQHLAELLEYCYTQQGYVKYMQE